MMKTLRQIAGAAMTTLPMLAAANYDVNIPAPHSPISGQIYGLHMEILWVCLAIFIVVFGVMFYSVFAHRKSKGAVAAHFHENTTIEIIWTIIPFLILALMAWPATKTVLAMKDASNPDMTIKVTAYQWKWQYDYLNDGVKFYSTLSTPREQVGSPSEPGKPTNANYLLETDNNVVVPVGKKIRLLITANDVIHGWYVPQLGVNQYGIPGFIKDSWFEANEPGIYRGQCSQICGKEHGYMPIVVEAKSAEDYAAWVKEQKAKQAAAESHDKVSLADPVAR
jgi:cytochrome c oxidase subunit II